MYLNHKNDRDNMINLNYHQLSFFPFFQRLEFPAVTQLCNQETLTRGRR
jgi:hypothetical protein